MVAVERIFDLAAFGVLFAGNLIVSPELNALPYHELFRKLGFVIAAMIAVLAAFVLMMWRSSAMVNVPVNVKPLPELTN